MIFRIARFMSTGPLLAAALLSPACAQAPAKLQDKTAAFPSKLDYVVLASLADSPNLLALSAYSAAGPHGSPP